MGIQQLLQKYSRNHREIIVYRYPKGSFSGGVYDIKKATKLKMWASVQPVQTDFHPDILTAPGNLSRSSNSVKIFSEEEIKIDNPSKDQRADRVEIDDVLYEAKSAGEYNHLSLGHFETICVKVSDK